MCRYLDIAAHYRQYKKTQQNLRTDVEVCFLQKRAKTYRSIAAFFCLKMSDRIDSSMVDRAGQSLTGRCLFWTVLPPLFGLPPFCGRNGGRFKT